MVVGFGGLVVLLGGLVHGAGALGVRLPLPREEEGGWGEEGAVSGLLLTLLTLLMLMVLYQIISCCCSQYR